MRFHPYVPWRLKFGDILQRSCYPHACYLLFTSSSPRHTHSLATAKFYSQDHHLRVRLLGLPKLHLLQEAMNLIPQLSHYLRRMFWARYPMEPPSWAREM
jgi:hypothetical protein